MSNKSKALAPSLMGGLALISAIGFYSPAVLAAPTDLGLVGVRSVHGRYLQAHTDGEMHASNKHRNEEETWHLVEVDRQRHIYALLNWRNGQFMSKTTNGCAPAVRTTLGPAQQWIMVSGKPYGILNAVAFKSAVDGTYLGANAPADDIRACGGEVASFSPAPPPTNNGGWSGWWVLQSATPPSPGKDFWNVTGNAIGNFASQIKPADVTALLALL